MRVYVGAKKREDFSSDEEFYKNFINKLENSKEFKKFEKEYKNKSDVVEEGFLSDIFDSLKNFVWDLIERFFIKPIKGLIFYESNVASPIDSNVFSPFKTALIYKLSLLIVLVLIGLHGNWIPFISAYVVSLILSNLDTNKILDKIEKNY